MKIDMNQIQQWIQDDLEEMSIHANRLENGGMNRELAIMSVAYHYGILRGMAAFDQEVELPERKEIEE